MPDFRTLVDFDKQNTPYYNDIHDQYRLHIRRFIESEISPHIESWCRNDDIPNAKQLIKKMIKHGGLWTFPFGYGTWKGHQWDEFFQIIFHQEITKTAMDGSGLWIHAYIVEPLRKFGTNKFHQRCVHQIDKGEAFISLCLSELKGASDVAQFQTTAKRTTDNKWVINGTKYWITNGGRADYFLTLVRTSPGGRKGLTVFLIPAANNGVFVSKIDLQGHRLDQTAQVVFKDVIVSDMHIVGKEDEGFKIIVNNFNRERFNIAARVVGWSSLCINEAIRWAQERKTFGKQLIKHQVIRHKIANMARKTIACQSMLERIAYQLKQERLTGKVKNSLPRNIALLKVQCTKTCQDVVIEASQIFGGRSYVRGGRGGKIERVYRMIRAMAIGGGSEEVMLDFAIRQAKL